jgi:hypothetical protein
MAAEILPEPSSPGSVVLDIGGSIGAAVVMVPATRAGTEIEIRNQADAWTGTHVAVLERRVAGGPVFAAVFGSLPEGDYYLRFRPDTDGTVHRIVVQGGRVVTTTWPNR